MAGFWEQILPGGLGAYGYSQLLGDFKDQRSNIRDTISGLQDWTQQQGQFQPYSLRGPTGTTSYGPDGMKMGLNAQQQDIQNQMFGGGQDLLQRSMMDTSARENDIYNQMRAAQRPMEQRQLGELQDTAHSQGRMGIRSEAYGGTPEQLAFEKARQESMMGARLGAMDQARSEQQNQYTQGLGMLNAGYTPMQQAQQQAAMGMDYGRLLQDPRNNMMNMYTNLGLGGLGTEVNMSNIMGNAFGNMIGAGQGMLGGIGGAVDDAGGWADLLKNIFG